MIARTAARFGLNYVWTAPWAFLCWYGRRLKEIPLAFAFFVLGCVYVAALMTVPSLLPAVGRLISAYAGASL
jgi:hypothetical protein